MSRADTIKLGAGKPVTVSYPFGPYEAVEGLRGKPLIDPEKCMGCGACANVCPAEAIEISWEGEFIAVRLSLRKCIFCARCEEACPAGAISLTEEIENSAEGFNEFEQTVKIYTLKCRICGKPFAAVRELCKVAEKLDPKDRWVLEICPECRRKLFAGWTSFARW